MGLLRNLLLQDEIKEKKRQFDEQMKLENAKLLVEQDKTKQAFQEFMQGTSEKYANISSTITSPEGERVQHPLLKEPGLQPDWERMTIGQEGAGVQVPKNLLEGYYDSLLKARQGETEHGYRMEEITQREKEQAKYPSGTTRQPTQYQIWKDQQPEGADISIEAYKRQTAQSVLNPSTEKPITIKDIPPESIAKFQSWEKTYKDNPYRSFEDWLKRTKGMPEGFKKQALREAKAYWGIE